MFFKHEASSDRALYYEGSSSLHRNRVRAAYRVLRKRDVGRRVARSAVWDCVSAGVESQWHLSFKLWVTDRMESV